MVRNIVLVLIVLQGDFRRVNWHGRSICGWQRRLVASSVGTDPPSMCSWAAPASVRPCPSRMVTLIALGLTVVNVVADLVPGFAITKGSVKGNFWLPLVVAAIQAIAATYAQKFSVKPS